MPSRDCGANNCYFQFTEKGRGREGEGGEGGAAGVKQVSHLAYGEVHDTNNHLVGKWLVRKEEEKEEEKGKKNGWGGVGVGGGGECSGFSKGS